MSMSSSQALGALAQKCERLEAQFPNYFLLLSEHEPQIWRLSYIEQEDVDTDSVLFNEADEALHDIANVAVRVLHRTGMEFETPAGNIENSFDQVDGWCRVLMCAFDYVEANDVLDYPTNPNQRELKNPFFLTRILLLEIAGLINQGVKGSDIFKRVIRQPNWPRFMELDWGDDDKPVDENESQPERKFTQQHLDTVRSIIEDNPTMTYQGITSAFREKNGNGIGNSRLQAILDYIRKNFPGEYLVEPRKRNA